MDVWIDLYSSRANVHAWRSQRTKTWQHFEAQQCHGSVPMVMWERWKILGVALFYFEMVFLGARLNYDGKMECNSFTQCSSFESYQTTSDLTSAWLFNTGNTSSARHSGWGIVHICLYTSRHIVIFFLNPFCFPLKWTNFQQIGRLPHSKFVWISQFDHIQSAPGRPYFSRVTDSSTQLPGREVGETGAGSCEEKAHRPVLLFRVKWHC